MEILKIKERNLNLTGFENLSGFTLHKKLKIL